MKIKAHWVEGGTVEIVGDLTTLARVQFTTEGRQLQKKQKLEIAAAALYDLLTDVNGLDENQVD